MAKASEAEGVSKSANPFLPAARGRSDLSRTRGRAPFGSRRLFASDIVTRLLRGSPRFPTARLVSESVGLARPASRSYPKSHRPALVFRSKATELFPCLPLVGRSTRAQQPGDVGVVLEGHPQRRFGYISVPNPPPR